MGIDFKGGTELAENTEKYLRYFWGNWNSVLQITDFVWVYVTVIFITDIMLVFTDPMFSGVILKTLGHMNCHKKKPDLVRRCMKASWDTCQYEEHGEGGNGEALLGAPAPWWDHRLSRMPMHAVSKMNFFPLFVHSVVLKQHRPFFGIFSLPGVRQRVSVLFGDVQVTALKNYLYKSNSQET